MNFGFAERDWVIVPMKYHFIKRDLYSETLSFESSQLDQSEFLMRI